MHITLRQLEVFAEVLKSGSTTQASQRLALSQSAVSAALTDLEGQLGVQLFDRVGKRLVVNEHGRLLYPRALALLEQAVEIEQLFREDNGAIRVFASSTIGNYILPEVIARYRRDFPTLPLEMSVGNSQDVINAVIDFRVDIGLIEGPCHNVDIIAEPWLEDELVVFASPASAKIAELAVTGFGQVGPGTMKGVKVVFIGTPEDGEKVKAAAEPAGVKYVFVEAK